MGQTKTGRRKRKARSKLGPNRVASALKAEAALRLRCSKMSFHEISSELDVSLSTAYKYVDDAVKAAAKRIADDAETIRAEMLLEVDELHRVWWPWAIGKAQAKDPQTKKIVEVQNGIPDRFAVDRVLRIMDRKMKLLGLIKEGEEGSTEAAKLLADRTAVYESMGLPELMRAFTDLVKSPVTLEGTAKQLPPPSNPAPASE